MSILSHLCPAGRLACRRRLNRTVFSCVEALEERIAPAANIWIGATSGSWNVGSNWSDGVPTADDDVTINPAATVTVSIDSGSISVNSITMVGDDALSITSGTLTVTAPSILHDFSVTSGTVNADTEMTLTGNSLWTGNPTFTGQIRNEGTLSITGDPNVGATLDNAGTIHNNGRLDFVANGQVNNLAGGVFEIVGMAGDGAYFGNFGGPGFFNAGVLRKLGPANADTSSVPFNNLATGTIDVDEGVLRLSSDGTWAGATVNIGPGAELRLDGGTKTWTGGYTGSGAGAFRFTAGTIAIGDGGATLSFPDGFFEISGNPSLNGQPLNNTGFLSLSGDPNLGATLDNTGTIHNNGRLDFVATGQVNNLADGVFEIVGMAGDGAYFGNFGGPGFFNTGAFRKLGPANADTSSVPFNNLATGTIDVDEGVFRFSSDGTWSGATLNVTVGAELRIDGGTKTWTGTYTGSGAGAVRFTAGAVAIGNGGATLDFPDGFFEISGNPALDGQPLTNARFISLSGDPNLGTTLNNTGTIHNNGRLDFVANGQVNNLAGGVFNIVGTVGDGAYFGNFGGPGFFNAGAFRKLGPANADTSSVPFNNLATGTIDVDEGVFRLSSDGTWAGATLNVTAGAELRIDGGTKTWTGTYTGSGAGAARFTAGTIAIDGGGATLNFPDGYFEVSGNPTLNGQPLANTGFLSLAGDPNLDTTIDNMGTIHNNGRLDFLTTGRVNNLVGGFFNVVGTAGDGAYFGNFGGPGFFNAGVFRKLGSANADTSSVPFNNLATGTIDVDEGVFRFSSDGTWAGATFNVAAKAELRFDGGTKTWTGAYTGSGAGAVHFTAGTIAIGDIGATLNFPDGFFEISGNPSLNGQALNNSGYLSLTGDPNLGTTLNNTGTIHNNGRLDFVANGQVNNLADGVFEIVGTAGDGAYFGNFGGPGFFNEGAFRKLGSANADTSSVPFNNLATGTIDVDEGVFRFSSDGTWAGATFNVAAKAELRFDGGTKTWTGAYTGSGAGAVHFTAGTIAIGDIGATLNFPDGFFEISGNPSLNGQALNNSGYLSLTGDPNLGTTLNNTGTIHNNGRLDFVANGQVNNLAGGVFEIVGTAGDGAYFGNFGGPGFFNDGAFRKLGSANADTSSVPFSNTGLVIVGAGTLGIPGQVAEIINSELTAGTWEVADGASLLISRTFTTNSATLIQHGTGVIGSIGDVLTTNLGSIQLLDGAALTVTRAFTNGGTLRLGIGSVLTIPGAFDQTSAGRTEFLIGGTPASEQFGRLVVGGAAGLGGTAAFVLENGYIPQIGESFPLATFGTTLGDFKTYDGFFIDRNLFLSPALTDASLVANALASPPNAKTVDSKNALTFTDADGDLVTIKLKGSGSTRIILVGDAADNADITRIDVTGATIKTKLSVSVKSKGGGNGQVNVGTIDASGLSLKSVKINGDLGKIEIGDGIEGSRAIDKLTVNSLGVGPEPSILFVRGPASGVGLSAAPESNVAGTVGVLKVKNNVKGVFNVTAGLADDAGLSATAVQAIRKVSIGGDIDGSAGGERAGLVRVLGDLGGVKVKGDVIGGADLSGIVVGGNAGNIKIEGDLMSADADRPVTISALGTVGVTKQNKSTALQKVQVGGDVLNAEILAGFRRDGTPRNADAGIGKIIVDGNWTASSAAAGVQDATNDGFGINDLLIDGGNGGIVSRIANITIAGDVSGSAADGDHFGITAQQIGKLSLGRARQPLIVGAGDVIDLATDFTAVDFA